MSVNNKVVQELEAQTGLYFDTESYCYYGTKKGLFFVAKAINNAWAISVSVCKDGGLPNKAILDMALQECDRIRSCEAQGYRVTYVVKSALTAKKERDALRTVLEILPDFLVRQGFQNCCERTGSTQELGIYVIAGAPHILTRSEYETNSVLVGEQMTSLDLKHENMIAGAVGALLGSLVGVAAILLLSKLGLVSAASGVVMGVCTLKLYEKMAGKLSYKGYIISGLIMLLMVYVANRLDWAIEIAKAFYVDIFTAFRATPSVCREYGLQSDYFLGLGQNLLFTGLGAGSIMFSQRASQKAGRISKVLMETQTNMN